MKKLYQTTILLSLIVITSSKAQPVFDIVSIGAGYTDQVYYNMSMGEIGSENNLNWDMAFQINGAESSILVNSKNNVRLFSSGFASVDWTNIISLDTVGIFNTNYELYNSDTTWWFGAFNHGLDASNVYDKGWGFYDVNTQIVTGDSIYFMIMPTGDVKKIWIESLAGNVYTFRHANVDGTNEVIATLDKSSFSGKNFGYYSIVNNTTLDREPLSTDWDLVFHQYLAITPIIYKVTGVLSNDSVEVAKAYPVDFSIANPWSNSYSGNINGIGYDWKSFDLSSFSWVLADSTIYFVKDRSGQIWKMMFTAFGGSANGEFEFAKELVSVTGLNDASNNIPFIKIYPNPTYDQLNIVTALDKPSAEVIICSSTGQVVRNEFVNKGAGLSTVTLDISGLEPGFYNIILKSGSQISQSKFLKIK